MAVGVRSRHTPASRFPLHVDQAASASGVAPVVLTSAAPPPAFTHTTAASVAPLHADPDSDINPDVVVGRDD